MKEAAEHGLVLRAPHGIAGSLRFERPAFVFGHRLKECTVGAFAYLNANGHSSLYRCRLGRYAQLGESCIVGPPEHPTDWFSSHPFAYTRPTHMPNMYRLPDFARLAPEASDRPSYAESVPNDTVLGHEAYLGAGSYVKRGITIGDGAMIGACSVVTRDIPPYAIAVGSPARVLRLRFAEKIVERFLKLEWWRYDLAPFKNAVDFSQVEATLAFFEQKKAEAALQPLRPDSYCLTPEGEGLKIEKLATPIYFA